MYHYFPSKRDLYVLARSDPDRQVPLTEQLAVGLHAHVQSLVARS